MTLAQSSTKLPFFSAKPFLIPLDQLSRRLNGFLRRIVSSLYVLHASRFPPFIEPFWLQTAFKAALRHGEAANAKYGIDRTETLVEPWSSTSSMIDALDLLVTRTEMIVHERSREFGSALDEEPLRFGGNGGSNYAAATVSNSSIDGQAAAELSAGQAVQREFKEQLCELAGAMFLSFEERIRYLLTWAFLSPSVSIPLSATDTNGPRNSLVDNGNSDDREVIALSERYSSVRFRVILALVGVDRSEQAYTLAEHHGDYRALVELCNHPKVGSQVRIQYYIETFKEDFAFELYRWYIEKGVSFFPSRLKLRGD